MTHQNNGIDVQGCVSIPLCKQRTYGYVSQIYTRVHAAVLFYGNDDVQ